MLAQPTTGLALAACLLAAPVTAQKVWVVDDNGGVGVDFQTVDAAVAAATDGDTILVRNGSYAHLHLTGRSLSLMAEAGHAPVLAGAWVEQVPAGGLVVLDGLTLDGGSTPGLLVTKPGLQVTTCAGPVWVEDCTVQGADGDGTAPLALFADGSPGIMAVDAADLILTRCIVRAGDGPHDLYIGGTQVQSNGDGGTAIEATGSSLAVYDSQLHGGSGGSSTYSEGRDGGHDIWLYSGELVAVGNALWSGDGGTGGSYTDPIWGFQCYGGGNAGHGIGLPGSGQSVHLAHIDFQAGAAGQPGGVPGSGILCWPGNQGSLLPGTAPQVVWMPIDLFQLTASDPIREQQLVTVTVTGSPGVLTQLVVSGHPGWLDLAPLVGFALVDLTGAWILPLGVTSTSGFASGAYLIPDLVLPGESTGLFVQVLAIDPVTGQISLGSATELTILDAAL